MPKPIPRTRTRPSGGSGTFVLGNKLRSFSALFVTTPSSLSAGNIARFYFQAIAKAGNGTFSDYAGSMIESVLLSVLMKEPKPLEG